VAGLELYRTRIAPEWIDYNGHLRDAYYGLIASLATDALMDRVGLDAAYRTRTAATLYTLEMHQHFLREVRGTDEILVRMRLLGVDRKRLHLALELERVSDGELAASVELMLLHVQQGTTPSSQPFPPAVSAALEELRRASAPLPAAGPGSRQMQLQRPA